jgi:8-oxo-dGTP pyrophosphatase MutT (NUDIX family)
MNELNPEHLPVIQRIIASTVIFSSDGKLLLGRKAATGGGVFADSWHIPGGGSEAGETLAVTAWREVNEEVVGLDAHESELEALTWLHGSRATTKTREDDTRVWCEMQFNYFRLVSDKSSGQLAQTLRPGSDFVELRFFSRAELSELSTVPGGIEAMIVSGELTPASLAPDSEL